jgi:hypothetical protein
MKLARRATGMVSSGGEKAASSGVPGMAMLAVALPQFFSQLR